MHLGHLLSSVYTDQPYEELEFRGPVSKNRKCTNIFCLITFLLSILTCLGTGIYGKKLFNFKLKWRFYFPPFLVLNLSNLKHDGFNGIQRSNDVDTSRRDFGEYDYNDGRSKRDLYYYGPSNEPQLIQNIPDKFDFGSLAVGILVGTVGCLVFVVIMRWIAGIIIWTIIGALETLLFLSEYFYLF